MEGFISIFLNSFLIYFGICMGIFIPLAGFSILIWVMFFRNKQKTK